MRSIATAVMGLSALFAVSCSDSASRSVPTAPAASVPQTGLPSGTSTTDPTGAALTGRVGYRVFVVRNVQLAFDRSLAIGLHPTRQPVAIQVEPGASVEVCPATINGDIDPNYSSWPRGSFGSCVSLDSAGHASLPSTGGGLHVVFAIRSHAAAQRPTVNVSVTYNAVDSFVEIVPPAETVSTTVAFTPRSSTIGAQAYLMPGYRAAPDVVVELSQQGRALKLGVKCDFGSEIECVGGAEPGQTATAAVTGRSPSDGRVAMLVAWA